MNGAAAPRRAFLRRNSPSRSALYTRSTFPLHARDLMPQAQQCACGRLPSLVHCRAASSVPAPTASGCAVRDMSSSLTLENIRSALIRQEDTILFNLLERAQFAANAPIYKSGAIPVPGEGFRARGSVIHAGHEYEVKRAKGNHA